MVSWLNRSDCRSSDCWRWRASVKKSCAWNAAPGRPALRVGRGTDCRFRRGRSSRRGGRRADRPAVTCRRRRPLRWRCTGSPGRARVYSARRLRTRSPSAVAWNGADIQTFDRSTARACSGAPAHACRCGLRQRAGPRRHGSCSRFRAEDRPGSSSSRTSASSAGSSARRRRARARRPARQERVPPAVTSTAAAARLDGARQGHRVPHPPACGACDRPRRPARRDARVQRGAAGCRS